MTKTPTDQDQAEQKRDAITVPPAHKTTNTTTPDKAAPKPVAEDDAEVDFFENVPV